MSVLIKGWEVPSNCDSCEFMDCEDVSFELLKYCRMNDMYIDDPLVRPYDCPLVELPEYHGKLIDADRLMRVYEDRLEKVADRYGVDSPEAGILSGAMKLLMIEPTIIDAE